MSFALKKKITWLDYSLMVFCLVFWKSYPPQFRKSTPQKLWWKDIVEFSHFQNFKNFSRIRQNFFFPLFYFASFFFAKVYFDFFFWQLSFHKHARSNWAFQFENKSDTIIVMNFIQKYHFLNNSFDKKKQNRRPWFAFLWWSPWTSKHTQTQQENIY